MLYVNYISKKEGGKGGEKNIFLQGYGLRSGHMYREGRKEERKDGWLIRGWGREGKNQDGGRSSNI